MRSDPSVGNESLHAVEQVRISASARGAGDCRHVRARLRFGQREGEDGAALGRAEQQRAPKLLVGAEQEWISAQPVHGENGIGSGAAIGELLANRAQRAHLHWICLGLGNQVLKAADLGERLGELRKFLGNLRAWLEHLRFLPHPGGEGEVPLLQKTDPHRLPSGEAGRALFGECQVRFAEVLGSHADRLRAGLVVEGTVQIRA